MLLPAFPSLISPLDLHSCICWVVCSPSGVGQCFYFYQCNPARSCYFYSTSFVKLHLRRKEQVEGHLSVAVWSGQDCV